MDIDILGGNYKQRFVNVNPQTMINWYVVNKTEIEGNKTLKAAFPFLGLTTFTEITGSRVRGMFVARTLKYNRCFAVVDDTLYELHKDGSATSRGALPNSISCTHPVYFCVNSNNQLGIFDGGSTACFMDDYTFVTNNGTLIGNIFDMDANTLSEIDSINFPNQSDNIGRVYWSASNDMSAWTGGDVFTPTFEADAVRKVVPFREDLYTFGDNTIELYLNSGVTFERRQGTALSYGLLATHSTAVYVNGIIFLGRNSSGGQPAVYQLTADYTIQQLSPNSITSQLGKYDSLEDCIGYLQYAMDGNVFYHLHVPSAQKTFVYNQLNSEWQVRRSTKPFQNNDGSTDQGMFRGFCHVNWDGASLFGDFYSGKIFKEDAKVFTEGGLPVLRERTTMIYTDEYRPFSVDCIEIDLTSGCGATTGQGSDPHLMFTVSKDRGNTYVNERLIPVGALGKYAQRTRIYSLGTETNWSFRISISDPVGLAITGAIAKGSLGAF